MEQPKNNLKIIADKKNTRVILPNMLTLIGVCIGLTSIRFALDEKFEFAIIAIIFAALFDWLDGRIARLIKGTSEVGKELDSLADVISFGVAPAFIMYFWKLNELGRFGWLLCLIYVSCVALRLARFNVNSNQEPSWRDNFFEGVPSPAGGILVLSPLIISLTDFNYVQLNYDIIVPTCFIIISLFLISKLGIIKLGLNSAYFKKDKVDKELINIVRKPVLRKTAARSLRAMCIGMSTRGDKLQTSYLLEQLSHSKKVPFLLLWGEKDNFIPCFLGKKIANFHRWVELKIISNSGHCVHDEDPSLFNKISYEWIRDLKTY